MLGSVFGGDLGTGDPAGECFNLLKNSLHRVGIRQQDLEYLCSVRDLGHFCQIQIHSEYQDQGKQGQGQKKVTEIGEGIEFKAQTKA